MSIVLENLGKCFEGHPVVSQVSLEVAEGELFVLLGPSGSGKSTVLRMIAGLLDPDSGRVLLRDRDVTRLRPQHRDVGLVFQHYALFRHMTVAQNIEFALRIRRTRSVERRHRCEELLELMGLIGLGERYPHQLSGGQQQRVALARALAHRPEVLLLDEPFGALDAKIRAELRRSLRRIQNELHVTTLFVTHDQEEGFELADRLGVMNFGRLLEVGPPQELYSRPRTEFVATFLGKANLMVGECTGNHLKLGEVRFPLDGKVTSAGLDRRVQILFRPEEVALEDSAEAMRWPLLGQATVDETVFSGGLEKIRLRLPHLAGARAIAPQAPFGADYSLIEATRSQHKARQLPLKPGDPVWIGLRRIHSLLHPGLALAVVLDASPASQAALELGAHVARLAHAQVAVLCLGHDPVSLGQQLERARERMASGLAGLELYGSPDPLAAAVARQNERRPLDLVIHGRVSRGQIEAVESLLTHGHYNLLLVPSRWQPPRRVLICVAVGEPAKNDVLFAGRLVRHLGAEATVMTVLPEHGSKSQIEQGHRFLEAGIRTLSLLDVRARGELRHGRARAEILAEIASGRHDLVVLGAPLPTNHRPRLAGVTAEVLKAPMALPLLIVRPQLPQLETVTPTPETLTQGVFHDPSEPDPHARPPAGVDGVDAGAGDPAECFVRSDA